MNQQESTIHTAKRLIARGVPTQSQRPQMEYIINRFEGTAGRPFPDGDEPDAEDGRMLLKRLADLSREAVRASGKETLHAAAS